MLQFIRNKSQGVLSWTIVLLIVVVFVLFGIENFFSPSSNSSSIAANVNGDKIYWSQVDRSFQSVYAQSASRPGFNPEVINQQSREIKSRILKNKVQRLALDNSARSLGYTVGKNQLEHEIANHPGFYINGKFSSEAYLEKLRSLGMSDAEFQVEMKRDILIGQLGQALELSNFATNTEIDHVLSLINQKRDFGYMIIPSSSFKDKIEITEEKIKEYYDKNNKSFMSKEKVSVEYVELTDESIVKDFDITEQDLKKYYSNNINIYTSPELVKVSHILIAAPRGSDAEKDGSAKAKANEVLSKLKNESVQFNDLVKEFSDDKLSAESNGNIGWLSAGEIKNPAFDRIAFGLAKNEVASEFVQTDFGFHILKVTDRKSKSVRPFADVKDSILTNLKKEKTEGKLIDKAEELANIAYEYPDSLEEVANSLELEIKTTQPFSKDGDSVGITSVQNFVEKAFSKDVVENGYNSELIKINDNKYAVLRLKERIPAKQIDLIHVSPQIKQTLEKIEAKNLAEAEGMKVKEMLISGSAPEMVTKRNGFAWNEVKSASRGYNKVDYGVVQRIFGLSRYSDDLRNKVDGISLASGDFVVFMLNKVHDGSIFDSLVEPNQELSDIRESYFKHIADTFSRYEYRLYFDSVMKNSNIKVNEVPNN